MNRSMKPLVYVALVRKIDGDKLITHRFEPGDIVEADETFETAARTQALRMVIEASGPEGAPT